MIQSPVFWCLLLFAPPAYWLLPARVRPYFLALISFCFIAYLAPKSAILLLALAVGLYFVLPFIARRDRYSITLLWVVVGVLVGVICYNKYLPSVVGALYNNAAAAAELIVPLGMSYYIFKMIHVAVDVYRRGSFTVSLSVFLCYLYLFTIFSAGPIQRLDLFIEHAEKTFDRESLIDGWTRIAFGFVKQFFIIDLLLLEIRYRMVPAAETTTNFAANFNLSTHELWLKLIFVYIVGYLNFSAYTDIAIGGSRLFGFRISENFNFPIIARSIGEFWQRWHMTLAAWAQGYVYSPLLGLTRNPYIALYASFAVIGLWHAGTLNRLSWGLYHATGVLVASLWTRYKRRRGGSSQRGPFGHVIGWLLTQGFVASSMVFVIGEYDNNILMSFRLLLRLIGI